MKKVLMLANHEYTIYNFRLELIEKLISEGYKVIISCPYGNRIPELEKKGCTFIESKMKRHGKNPFSDLALLRRYNQILKEVKPNIVLSFTIKPNIYGAIACRKVNTPIIPNITGLGSAVENETLVQKIIINLYKYSFKKINTVFFQNEENRQFFINHNIKIENPVLIPGSGVNLNKYQLLDYPNEKSIHFVFISRIMKEKGIDLFLKAARELKMKYSNLFFHICGFCEEDYDELIKELHNENIVIYHGMVENIQDILLETHCTVHPTYYPEGLSNVLLESSAVGRPIITTNRSGCREVVGPNNGFLVNVNDYEDLISKLESFIELSYNERRKMGLAGRKYVECKFDRNIVLDEYVKNIKILSEKNG